MAESSREEIAKLEALYANNPEGRVFTHLAEAYRKAGELERARTILEEGLTKHATYASAHVVLGRVLLDLQQPDEAAEAFRRVLSLDPHNLVALRSLGDIARAAGRNAEAIGYFEELLHQDQSNEEIVGIIEELSARPAPEGAAPEAQVFADTQAEAEPQPAAPEFTESAPPAQAATEPELDTTVGADLNLDWVPDVGGEFDSLPGDLGSLTSQNSSADETPDLPTFALPEGDLGDLGDFGSLGSLDASESAPEPEPEAAATSSFEDFSLPDLDEQTGESRTEEVDVAEETPELVTETIAELYRSQGLHDRAAEVYRALLRERPGDPQLQARLSEAEAAARPTPPPQAAEPETAAQPAEPEPVAQPAEPAPWDTTLSFEEQVASFESEAPEAPDQGAPAAGLRAEPEPPDAEAWLAGAAGIAESPPTPYAWAEQSADPADTSPPVSEYFQGLLAWRPPARAVEKAPEPAAPPAAPAAAQPQTTTAPAAAHEAAETAAAYEPAAMPYEEEDALLLLEEQAEPAPEAAAEPPSPPAPAAQATPAPAPAPPPAAPAAPEPWEAQPAEAGSTATNSEDAFDAWFGPTEEAAPAAPAAAADETTSPTEAGGEDDDDLEMFRSWLQSLKK